MFTQAGCGSEDSTGSLAHPKGAAHQPASARHRVLHVNEQAPFQSIWVPCEFVGPVDRANWDPVFLSFSEQFVFGQSPHELKNLGFYKFEICIAYVPVLPNRVHESFRPAHPFEQVVPVPPRNDYNVAETVAARVNALRHPSTQRASVPLSSQDGPIGAVVHHYVLL